MTETVATLDEAIRLLRCATVGHSWTGEDRENVMALIAEVERMRESLRWYADLNNWSYQEWEYADEFGDNVTANAIPADHDQGHRARVALYHPTNGKIGSPP